MDSFEQLIGKLLSAEGWWIRQGFKVELTKEEKKGNRKAFDAKT